jgi:hypothetical protein
MKHLRRRREIPNLRRRREGEAPEQQERKRST